MDGIKTDLKNGCNQLIGITKDRKGGTVISKVLQLLLMLY